MMRTLLLMVFASSLSLASVQLNQKADFDIARLNESGRRAYEELMTAKAFRIGGVGYAGTISHQTEVLRALLYDRNAVEALISLVNHGSPEGSLYGLLGLRLKNPEIYKQELERYKNRAELPARDVAFMGKEKDVLGKGQVLTQMGCVWMHEDAQKVVGYIELGIYDQFFKEEKEL